MDLKKLKNQVVSKFEQFWEWIFTSDEDRYYHRLYEDRAKAAIAVVFLFIFFVIWLDNYIKYHF